MKQNLLVLCVLLALAACSEEIDRGKEDSIKVEGDRVILAEADKATFLKVAAVGKDMGSVLRLPGRLIWNENRTVRVFPQLGGRVVRIQAEIGAQVKAGQPLALLASPDFGQAHAETRKAQADLKLAKHTLERNRELLDAGVVARKELLQAEADAARAEAEADRAARRMALLGGEGDGSYTLRSPLAGVVVERNLNPGQEFRPDQPSAPLFVITEPSSLWIQLDAGEADLASLKPGTRFAIEVKQYPGERFQGVIRHVADFVDPASRTVKVRGEVANGDRRLKGEMFVTALIELPPTDTLHVPANAVFLAGDKRYVFVEEGAGRYRRQEVQVGPERDGRVDIHSGVRESDKVIAEGNLHLIKFFKAADQSPRLAR
ncbi:MAG: Secretion protein HlyD [Rhodocyclaceae bacterium]|nr:Secretion protein HlyD [Rhodocyclaceae bacterium]